jgi:phosphatidylethanolamine/phosphatidyl-N-methylethanolamine N-methyltransferase
MDGRLVELPAHGGCDHDPSRSPRRIRLRLVVRLETGGTAIAVSRPRFHDEQGDGRLMDIRLEDVRSAYERHSHFYDSFFGPVLHLGRVQTVEAMRCAPGERVLEVGVGTGLSLPMYPKGVRVVGIDLSIPMLGKALPRANERGAGLAAMDAARLGFADGSFDKVVAMYVASVVPDPTALAAEMRRVCRTEDGLYFVNHFQSANSAVAIAERTFAPLSRLLGFRPDFSLDGFLSDAGLDVVERRPAGPFGYWTYLQARRRRADAGSRRSQLDRAA